MLLKKLDHYFDMFSNILGQISIYVVILMILNVFFDVVMRYFFGTGSIAMQEMEWHLFSIVILFGISYTFKDDGHVRVDLIYDRLKPKTQAIINIVGVLVFIIPLCLLIIFGSLEFVKEAYDFNEISPDPGGLTHRYIIKGAIPLAFLFLIISSVGVLVKNLILLKEDS